MDATDVLDGWMQWMYWMGAWLVGWLVGWLRWVNGVVGWLVGGLVGWLVVFPSVTDEVS